MDSLNSLKSLPFSERPRERALQSGVEVLTDTELLAIILRVGNKGKNVLTLAQTLLTKFQNLRNLSIQTIGDLKGIPGIGTAKALEIKACLEIARRFHQATIVPGENLPNSQKVFEHFHELLRDDKKEKFFVLMLDCKNCIIRKELVSIGCLNKSIVHPREVFSIAIRESAYSVLLVHNHPSGDPSPSQDDIIVTNRLVKAGEIIGIKVLDHIIIGNGRYSSFAEMSLL